VYCAMSHTLKSLKGKEYCRSSMEKYDRDKRILEEVRENHKVAGALDPLLALLSNFESPVHFKSQVDMLFDLWDVDGTDGITYKEAEMGALSLGLSPCIKLEEDFWDALTLNGSLCNEMGELDRKSFETAMRLQLQEYSQRLLSNKMQHSIRCENENTPVLFSLKMAMMEIMDSSARRRIADHTASEPSLRIRSPIVEVVDHQGDTSHSMSFPFPPAQGVRVETDQQLHRVFPLRSGFTSTGRNVKFGGQDHESLDQSAGADGVGGGGVGNDGGGGVLKELLEQVKLLRTEYEVSHRTIETLQVQMQQQSTQMAALQHSHRSVETMMKDTQESVTRALDLLGSENLTVGILPRQSLSLSSAGEMVLGEGADGAHVAQRSLGGQQVSMGSSETSINSSVTTRPMYDSTVAAETQPSRVSLKSRLDSISHNGRGGSDNTQQRNCFSNRPSLNTYALSGEESGMNSKYQEVHEPSYSWTSKLSKLVGLPDRDRTNQQWQSNEPHTDTVRADLKKARERLESSLSTQSDVQTLESHGKCTEVAGVPKRAYPLKSYHEN
jgi:hypothetical protein